MIIYKISIGDYYWYGGTVMKLYTTKNRHKEEYDKGHTNRLYDKIRELGGWEQAQFKQVCDDDRQRLDQLRNDGTDYCLNKPTTEELETKRQATLQYHKAYNAKNWRKYSQSFKGEVANQQLTA